MTPQRGPKEDAASPTPQKWKDAVKLRLEELNWSQSELTREVAKEVEVTEQAISYVLTKAKQSSLRGPIERAIGWHNGPQELDAVAAMFDGQKRSATVVSRNLSRLELSSIVDQLDVQSIAKLLIEARYLLEVQRAEKERREAHVHAVSDVAMAQARSKINALELKSQIAKLSEEEKFAVAEVAKVEQAVEVIEGEIRALRAQEGELPKNVEALASKARAKRQEVGAEHRDIRQQILERIRKLETLQSDYAKRLEQAQSDQEIAAHRLREIERLRTHDDDDTEKP